MKIVIGSDHAGYELKSALVNWLKNNNYECLDVGTYSKESCDYPDIVKEVAKKVSNNEYTHGIIICSTGIGVTIAANKFKNIRAALVYNLEVAKLSRQHNNANILTLGAKFTPTELAIDILKTWLNTEFEGERHQRRINKINEIEKENFK